MARAVASRRDSKPIDDKGMFSLKFQRWIEQVTQLVNPRLVQRKTTDYTLVSADAGVTVDPLGDTVTINLPDATLVTGLEFYTQNSGALGTVNLLPILGQKIAGSDLIAIPASLPYSSPFVKSDGINWVLLGHIAGDISTLIEYWIDDTGDALVDDTGDTLYFVE